MSNCLTSTLRPQPCVSDVALASPCECQILYQTETAVEHPQTFWKANTTHGAAGPGNCVSLSPWYGGEEGQCLKPRSQPREEGIIMKLETTTISHAVQRQQPFDCQSCDPSASHRLRRRYHRGAYQAGTLHSSTSTAFRVGERLS